MSSRRSSRAQMQGGRSDDTMPQGGMDHSWVTNPSSGWRKVAASPSALCFSAAKSSGTSRIYYDGCVNRASLKGTTEEAVLWVGLPIDGAWKWSWGVVLVVICRGDLVYRQFGCRHRLVHKYSVCERVTRTRMKYGLTWNGTFRWDWIKHQNDRDKLRLVS